MEYNKNQLNKKNQTEYVGRFPEKSTKMVTVLIEIF